MENAELGADPGDWGYTKFSAQAAGWPPEPPP